MLPSSIYRYVWMTTRRRQIQIFALTAVVVPLAMVPLELQRRMVDDVIASGDLVSLAVLGALYLGVVLVQNGFKFVLNVTKGRVLEDVASDLRRRVLERLGAGPPRDAEVDEGTVVSVLAAESEDVAGFVCESLSVPLLQGGTILAIAGYLLWVQPLIAALAVLVYLPQVFTIPRIQHAINRLSKSRIGMVRRLGHEAMGVAGGHDRSTRRAEKLIGDIYATRIRIYLRKYFLTLFNNVLDALGPIIVLVVGGYLVIHGRADVATLVVFISGFQKLADPWDQLIGYYRTAQIAHVSYRLVAGVLRGEPTPVAAQAG